MTGSPVRKVAADLKSEGQPHLCLASAEQCSALESAMTEKLVRLKADLRDAVTETFWLCLLQGMTDIAHAQYGFVAKRRDVGDDHGDHVHGVALYKQHHNRIRPVLHREYEHGASGLPCSHMKHGKVLLIPECMSDYFTIDQTTLFPLQPEAYLAVPLFVRGRCFAHFGLMWTRDGLGRRELSWPTIEMMMHSLEDLVTDRLVSGSSPHQRQPQQAQPEQRQLPTPECKPNTPPPEHTPTTTPSLKPFARSLSHELRTPMHGVVGMLDVMHATVQEQIESSPSQTMRQVFQSLRDNIETIQVSCKRAVEAADNVVHAYDMDLQIPETPLALGDIEQAHSTPALPGGAQSSQPTNYFDYKPTRLIEGNNTCNPHKRRRTRTEPEWQFSSPTAIRYQQQSPLTKPSRPTTLPPLFNACSRTPPEDGNEVTSTKIECLGSPPAVTTYCSLRELIPVIIQGCLQVGDQPDSVITSPTMAGQRIEVRSRSANGDIIQKVIEWSVEREVPRSILADERDISKLISAVVLNAVKFTEAGMIRLEVKLAQAGQAGQAGPQSRKRSLMIVCSDTGVGIPEDFRPQLFKPFSREDDSTTRSTEGLGLGLLVAKGLSRRLGGDLTLVRSEVRGPQRGSQFEIRVPVEVNESGSLFQPLEPKALPSLINALGTVTTSTTTTAAAAAAAGTTTSSGNTSPLKASVSDLNSPALYDRNLAKKYPLTFLIAEDNKINRKILVSMLAKLGYDKDRDVHVAFDGREAVRIMNNLKLQGGHTLDPKDQCNDGTSPRAGDGGRATATATATATKDIVVLMDLWMPEMDGYQATEEIFRVFAHDSPSTPTPTPTTTTTTTTGTTTSITNHESDQQQQQQQQTAKVKSSNKVKVKILAVSADVTDEALDRATRMGMAGFMTKPYKLMDLQRLITDFCTFS